MQLLLALAVAMASVEGVIVDREGGAIPGCSVTLIDSAGVRRTAVSDAEGKYRILAVATGEATLIADLPGFERSERTIFLGEGANVPRAVALVPREPEVITISCNLVCSESEPDSVWRMPKCEDYDFDSLLIEAVERGDRSALAHLRQRYDKVKTYAQKHRLAGAALRRDSNDATYWRELFAFASDAVRFPQVAHEISDEFGRWCLERGLPAEEYRGAAVHALAQISGDPRSRPLLLDALKTRDPIVVSIAVDGLATQRDESALADIASALDALPGDQSWIALALSGYQSEAADAIALRYLDGNHRLTYERERANGSR